MVDAADRAALRVRLDWPEDGIGTRAARRRTAGGAGLLPRTLQQPSATSAGNDPNVGAAGQPAGPPQLDQPTAEPYPAPGAIAAVVQAAEAVTAVGERLAALSQQVARLADNVAAMRLDDATLAESMAALEVNAASQADALADVARAVDALSSRIPEPETKSAAAKPRSRRPSSGKATTPPPVSNPQAEADPQAQADPDPQAQATGPAQP